MILNSRKEHILDFIVRDFVRTAIPISSGRVSEKKVIGDGIAGSPATIRNIMLELDEEGYLYQPHTSAGRVPTEQGYRYFVDNLMEARVPEPEIRYRIDEILESLGDEADFVFDNLSRAISGHLKLFSGIGFLDEEERIFGRGLSEVLKEPEFEERDLAVEFADFTENVKNNLLEIDSDFAGVAFAPQFDIKRFGAVSVAFDDQELGRCVVFSYGPKRMNYERAASILQYAAKDIRGKSKKYAGRRKK